MKGDLIPLGYIVSAHGIKGHVLLKTFSGEGTSLLRNIFLYLRKEDDTFLSLRLLESKPFKKFFIVKFETVNDRNMAESLANCMVFIDRTDIPKAEEDEYYWFDLIGCDVYSLNGKYIGKIDSLIETGGVDVIVVKHLAEEHLYPLIKDVVKEVDLLKKKVLLDISAFVEAGL